MKIPVKTLIASAMLLWSAGCSKSDGDDIHVIPVTVEGIEAVNVDNSGRNPAVSSEPIKKEAYMIGIKWVTTDADPDGDQYVTPGSNMDGRYYQSPSVKYQQRIFCNTDFNAENPAGSNVSQYFKQIEYLPEGVDEGFVLLVSPDPGVHSFRVAYYLNGAEEFSSDTPNVTLQ